MGRCEAIKPTGERCKGAAMPGAGWCYSHDPAYASQRRRNASQGGRTGGRGRGGGGELQELKRAIQGVIDGVLSGSLETATGAVAFQGYNSLLRATEVERRTFDVAALLERMDALEARADRLRGA